ncbi:energy transducer TonB [uncultured Pseudoteredinibacter sp.]|uniref:energy transducer TonB n=1 Tax=uncultured Pseudoteredinibacter sp. TaxID=1641701 RepID=UPI00262F4354|nr:energy transducer TonB [uncultured Pseudoteredinibacter sp.]
MKIFIGVLFLILLTGCTSIYIREIRPKPDISALNNGVDLGSVVNSPQQLYPKKEHSRQQGGWVLLAVDVNSEGVLNNIKPIDYSPTKNFVPYAVKYAREAKLNKPEEGEVIKNYYFLVVFEIWKHE